MAGVNAHSYNCGAEHSENKKRSRQKKRSENNRSNFVLEERQPEQCLRAKQFCDDENGSDPHERAERRDDRRQLAAALLRLRPGIREAIVLRYYEGMSVAEIADVLGISTGTVKSQASRALAALRGNPALADLEDWS